MKQEVGNLASSALASEDERSEATSPEFPEEREEEVADDLSGHETLSTHPSDEGEDEGPIDLRKKPGEKPRMTPNAANNGSGNRRPEVTNPATDAILDMFQRTLLNAGLPHYLSPLLFLGGAAAASEDLAKAVTNPDQLPFPYRTLLPGVGSDLVGSQTPVVCDPYGRRHLLVQGQDGNVMTIPLAPDTSSITNFEKTLSRASGGTAFKKRDYYAQKEHEEDEDSYAERSRYRASHPSSHPTRHHRQEASPESYHHHPVRPKSELVSRLESAPVLSQLDYLTYRENAEKRASRLRNSEPEDLSLGGSDGSTEEGSPRRNYDDQRDWDTYSHRGRWGQASVDVREEEARRFFRSRSCSDLLKFKLPRERADHLTPASRSCPSLAGPTNPPPLAPISGTNSNNARWRVTDSSSHHHHRKRKYVTHRQEVRAEEARCEEMETEEAREEDEEEEEEEEEERKQEIVNAPITRLFNPKTATRPKMARMYKEERVETPDDDQTRRHQREPRRVTRYHEDEDDEEEALRQSLHRHREGARMTPEQEETFLERLRHSVPLQYDAYSYYTQMMRSWTEQRHRDLYPEDRRPSSNSSPSPQRSLQSHVTSSYQTPRSPDTTNASPPNSLLVAAISSPHLNSLQGPPGSPTLPDSRKAARVLTGKHVRQGTGASPATLLTLRQKIQERQRAKEVSSQTTHHFGRSTNNAKVGRDLKRKNNGLPPSIPLVNKGR